jgi:hypothetical protein
MAVVVVAAAVRLQAVLGGILSLAAELQRGLKVMAPQAVREEGDLAAPPALP